VNANTNIFIFCKLKDWRLARSQACINGAYSYKSPSTNGTNISHIDAVLIPNVGGGGASSSIASVPDAAQYPAMTIPIGTCIRVLFVICLERLTILKI